MIKKLQLFCLTLLSSAFVQAQTNLPQACGTQAPPQQWEEWMSKEIEKFKQGMANAHTQQVNYTIPVIVHVISFGEAVGTFPNIDSPQVRTQIDVLNRDFAGLGLNTANTPAPFSNFLAGNTGIKFCRAKTKPNGAVLDMEGIDRVDGTIYTWQNTNTPTINIQNYIETVVKPNTIFDPTKYFNIWVSDRPPSSTLDGYATYPASSGLTGIFGGGMSVGTSSTDGIWVYVKAFGTTGAINPVVTNEGRTATHETGHWLGLRHIWGDGNCLSDYCADTPPAKQANTGCPPFPSYIDRCGVGQSSYGEMTMNHMDMTNDSCRYMFTSDQKMRMLTAMSQCPNRNLLGADGLCTAYTATSLMPAPSFTIGTPCVNRPFSPYNTSSGFPDPNFIWSSTPPANFSPNPTVANPAITFNTAGTYTLSLVATNTVGTATYTRVVVTTSLCGAQFGCLDSLRMIKAADSLITYKTTTSNIVAGCQTGFTGYLTGNNCYMDKEYAQFFTPNTYSGTPYPEINSVIVLFDSVGTNYTHPNTQISCKIYGGSVNYGPVSALASVHEDLMNIVASTKTNSVRYIGNVNQLVTPVLTVKRIIPYKFDFGPPVVINSPNTGFFVAVDVPQTFPGDSIRIFTSTRSTNTSPTSDSSAWALTFNNIWRPLKSYRGSKVQLAMMPIITCSPLVGIKEEKLSAFASNISVVPNPNNGVFNMIFTLTKEEEVHIRIYNSIGQEVSSDHLQGVKNNVMNIDLSSKPDGIYFTDISNGSEHVVKKVVVMH